MADHNLSAPKREKPAKKGKRRWYKSPTLWRQATMIFFFAFIFRVAYRHLQSGGGPSGSPSIEAYCPFGGLASLYQFITTGGFVRHIEPSSLIILAAVVLLTLLFSRGFCSWICPFGSVQEGIGMLGKKLLRKSYNPTGVWDRALRYLKYVVFIAIISLSWWSGSLIFREYDPFLAFFQFGQKADEFLWGYVALGAVLIGSIFIDRFFCKYACPLGAVLAVLGKFGLTRVRRDARICANCVLCEASCPAHINIKQFTEITDAECNQCMECIASCPIPNALTVRASRLRFSHPVYASVMVIGLFGVIGVSQATRMWDNTTEPMSAQSRPEPARTVDVRGWMTLNDVSHSFGVPLDRLYRDTGLSRDVAPDVPMREIREKYNLDFDTDSVRDAVARYMEENPAAARTAADTLPRGRSRNEPPAAGRGEQRGGGRGTGIGKDGERGQGQGAGVSGDGFIVRGNMTINEIVLKTGIPKDKLLKEAGLPPDVPAREPIRNWIFDYRSTPRRIRDAVNKLQ